MTDYKNIKGKKIKFFTTDLSNEQAEGQIFYSDTDSDFKTVISTAAWSSSGPILTATRGISNTGSVDASVAYGGYTTTNVATTLEYNGVGWITASDMPGNYPESSKGGTQTAVISTGGDSTNNGGAATREYDGTNWTAGGNLGTGRYALDGDGTQTAAFVCAGNVNPGSGVVPQTLTEEYNGTAWSESGDLSNARNRHSTAGLQTAGLAFGGSSDTPMTISATSSSTEEYDGSSWTSGGTMGTARYSIRGGGIQTNALAFGGNVPGKTANTELYNGTTWTEMNNLAVVTTSGGGDGLGTTKSWLSVGGATNPGNTNLSTTQEFHITTSVITAGAWSNGANYPVTIQDPAGAGPTTAAVIFGGYDGPQYVGTTNEYNGTAYSSSNPMGTGRAVYQTGTGSQTAALQASGYATTEHTGKSEEYNGTSWSEGNDLNNTRYSATGGGIQTSALVCGGNGNPGNSANAYNESYNGTSWSNETALPGTTAGGKMYSGTGETASLIIGFGDSKNDTISYDGSSWTDLGHHLVVGKTTAAGGSQQGTTTAALVAGGFDPSPAIVTTSQVYNGTSWATSPSMATARRGGAASGTATSCLGVGGERPAQSNHTEEFAGETTSFNLKTITDS